MPSEFLLGSSVLVLFGAVILIFVLLWAVPVRLWIEAVFSGVTIKIGQLIGMRLRKVNPAGVVRPLISATKAGLHLDANELEAHILAGGDVVSTISKGGRVRVCMCP